MRIYRAIMHSMKIIFKNTKNTRPKDRKRRKNFNNGHQFTLTYIHPHTHTLIYMSMTKYEVRQNIKFYILSRQNIICQDKI